MSTYNIGIIPGDGTGPEVVGEAIKVLDAACSKIWIYSQQNNL